jgi:hypothetical protein
MSIKRVAWTGTHLNRASLIAWEVCVRYSADQGAVLVKSEGDTQSR